MLIRSMCRLLESIKYVNGDLHSLSYHQDRVDQAIFTHFPGREKIALSKIIKIPPNLTGIQKCRFIYDQDDYQYEFVPYQIKPISSLRLIDVGDYTYRHKYLDRSIIDSFYENRLDCDDVILTQYDMITDSSYANIAFFDGKKWYTSTTPLLPGVKRQYLLDRGILNLTEIRITDLHRYEKLSLINALLDLGQIEIPVNHLMLQ